MQIKARDYYYIPELCNKWHIEPTELEYLIENAALVAHFYLLGLEVEYGYFERTADGRCHNVPCEVKKVRGLCPLKPDDCRKIFRRGKTVIDSFACSESNAYCHINKKNGLKVLNSDIVITAKNISQFERSHHFQNEHFLPDTKLHADDLYHENNYTYVKLGDEEFKFGMIQARVIRLLHEASKTSNPWIYGKILLSEAGSRSQKLCDLFKRQKNWKQIILSDGKGAYRLNSSTKK